MASRLKIDRFSLISLFFILLKLGLHFFTNTRYELHRDEMLYFNMGDHLDFGYATVPPMIGIFAFISKSIFGFSVFGIRFFPAILGVASVYLVSKIVKALGGGMMALVLACTAFVLSPGFLIFNTLFSPNVFEQFFWLLATFLLLKLVIDQEPKLWLWIGIVLGLAFLTKYSILFFICGFFTAILFSPHRYVLISRYFFYAIGIAAFLVFPNLIWQYQHGLPVLHHMTELKRTQLANLSYQNFFLDLFSLNSLFSTVALFGLVTLLFFKTERKYFYLGFASLIILLLFLLLNGKGYYALGLIPFLYSFGAYAMEKYLIARLNWINYGVLLVSICTSLLILPYGLPILSFKNLSLYTQKVGHHLIYPFSYWEDGQKHASSQVYADMTGWQELTRLVAKAYQLLPQVEQQKCTIYAERNYGYAGAIHFYGKAYGLPEAITFLESYVLWAPDHIPNGPFIYINYEIDDFKDLFSDIVLVGSVEDEYFREKGLKVFLCRNPKVDISKIYFQKAIEEKQRFYSF